MYTCERARAPAHKKRVPSRHLNSTTRSAEVDATEIFPSPPLSPLFFRSAFVRSLAFLRSLFASALVVFHASRGNWRNRGKSVDNNRHFFFQLRGCRSADGEERRKEGERQEETLTLQKLAFLPRPRKF